MLGLIKTGYRYLLRHKAHTLLNVMGLALGITACLLIFTYVRYESRYDRHVPDHERIARVHMTWVFGDTRLEVAPTVTFTGPWVARTFPYVEQQARLKYPGSEFVRYGDKTTQVTNLGFADSTFLALFSVPLQGTSVEDALRDPYTLVPTESTAKNIFGDHSAIGETVLIDTTAYLVTGIMPDWPNQSHLRINALASLISDPESREDSWNSSGWFTYAKVNHPDDIRRLDAEMTSTLKAELGEDFTQELGAMALADVHTQSTRASEHVRAADPTYHLLFSVLAMLILGIAVMNYVNMATARSLERAKEIGIRTAMGARRSQLWVQFMGEAFILCAVAVLLALPAALLAMPLLEQISGLEMDVNLLRDAEIWAVAFGIGFVTALLAGVYPAVALSGIKPVATAHKGAASVKGGAIFRRVLVVSQFFIVTVLLYGVTVVYTQLRHIQETPLGYDKSHVVFLPFDQPVKPFETPLKNALRSVPGVLSVSTTAHVPGRGVQSTIFAKTPNDEDVLVNNIWVDSSFVPTLKLTLVTGRNLSEYSRKPLTEIILNESAIRFFGWTSPEEAIGHHMRCNYAVEACEIVGVVKDFYMQSLHSPVEPLILISTPTSMHGQLMLKIDAELMRDSSPLEAAWESVVPMRPYLLRHLDEIQATSYRFERQAEALFRSMAGLGIVLALLGLYGMTSYSAVRRTKEIGIRKVLGASLLQLFRTLTSGIAALVAFGVLLAIPLAWWLMDQWLQGFSSRAAIPWSVFVLIAVVQFVLAYATMAYHSIRVAKVNPTESLRSE